MQVSYLDWTLIDFYFIFVLGIDLYFSERCANWIVSALVVMTVVIRMVQIAWPLYTMVGSQTTILVGIGSHKFLGGSKNAN